jgi:AbiJ N-terminal domain 5
MPRIPPQDMLRLKEAAVSTFDNEKWLELGVLTSCSDVIDRHPRLLRSMSWNDPDYPGNVLQVLLTIIDRSPENAEIVRSYIDDGMTQVVNASSISRLGPKIVFQPNV